jgi:hypothetical protein
MLFEPGGRRLDVKTGPTDTKCFFCTPNPSKIPKATRIATSNARGDLYRGLVIEKLRVMASVQQKCLAGCTVCLVSPREQSRWRHCHSAPHHAYSLSLSLGTCLFPVVCYNWAEVPILILISPTQARIHCEDDIQTRILRRMTPFQRGQTTHS